ncbi:hypothetical protein [Mitsuokella multacida]|uniref:hypothetical protein n=1 Tax=Mitsuokella multacida TaxID=52226 RepID=UPI00266627AE|nr:hypothetical protein [Mitsuokella multacida]
MDKYVFLVFLLAPGFIACSVAFLLHAFPDKGSEIRNVMRYFTYSFFALFLTAAGGLLLGFYSGTDTLTEIYGRFDGVAYSLKFMAMLILASILTGAVWPLFGKRIFLKAANVANVMAGRNPVFPDGRLIDDMLDDGAHHFIVVEKDGKTIAMGLYNGLSEPAADLTEISVTAYPEYQEAFQQAQASEEDSPLKHLKYVYTQVEHDFIIREYDFPREWLPEDER